MADLPPLTTNPRVAWVGVGALGLLYSASLARAGVETHLLLRSDYEVAAARGISVRSVDGDFHVPPTAFHAHRSPDTLPTPDLVVISTKTTANPDLPGLLRPLVGPHTRLLTLQNGLGNEQLLADHFGPHRVFGGMAFVSVHRIAPASVDHQHAGHITLGRYAPPSSAGPDAHTCELAGLLGRSGFRMIPLDSLARGRWEKQLWNVPFNGLGAAMLADTEQLLRTEEGRRLVLEVMGEVVAVARADGVTFHEKLPEEKVCYTLGMGPYRTSMQLDREAGRAMEVDSIITSVRRCAAVHKVRTPRLDLLELQLRSIDTANSGAG